ncbi:helicase-related protein [Alkalicoccus urumqiensis]|uniref:DNA/RNA helicase n=1 Tax=Alkalicoccus urumqiensis TaxID=1548213 RepID=A0A2P6MHA8_ALKUR|nr:helicase-related protein [Alkalicoccus urumqiensis]PRO65672.1 DNA/RNA helicase [Alkalicoccus urumqiensis]
MFPHRQITAEEAAPHLEAATIRHAEQLLNENDAITRIPAQKTICIRCGNTDAALFGTVKNCARCHKECTYCRACVDMGAIRSCASLYTLTDAPHRPEAGSTTWDGTLTPMQQNAADTLVRGYEKRLPEQLLWAVCGAGKTEMLFPVITRALQDGPVALAAPRRDVVQELAPRLASAFPNARVHALHGDIPAETRYTTADIYVATTHQLFRLAPVFPLVIIDEVDAFPYTLDARLKKAAARITAPGGSRIDVTATPSRNQRRLQKSGKLPAAVVPRRFHGADLPVPRLSWCRWQKEAAAGRVSGPLRIFLERHADRPVMLFVAHVDDLETVACAVNILPRTVTTVHAGEPERSSRIHAFRNGDVDVLVTTTILERGVTIPRVQVAVLSAEAEIFTETALIQIAGRAGRSASEPSGDVAFFHEGATVAMWRAVRTIRELNR